MQLRLLLSTICAAAGVAAIALAQAQPDGFFKGFKANAKFFPPDGKAKNKDKGKGIVTFLTVVDREGKAVGPPQRAVFSGTPKFSPDGSKLVTTHQGMQGATNTDIYVVDLDGGRATRISSDPAVEGNPVWTPLGDRVVYQSNRAGAISIYHRAAGGEGPEELLYEHPAGANMNIMDVSPDGRFITFFGTAEPTAAGQTPNRGIYILPVAGSRKPIPFVQTAAQEDSSHFSPDGRFIAYRSDESGKNEIYVRPFNPASIGAGNAKWQVSTQGGVAVAWKGDGKEMYYVTPEGAVMAVEVTSAPEFKAGTPKQLFQMPGRNAAAGDAGARFAANAEGTRFAVVVPIEADMTPVLDLLPRGK